MELVREVHRQDPILLEFKPKQPAGVEVATWGRPGVDQRLPEVRDSGRSQEPLAEARQDQHRD